MYVSVPQDKDVSLTCQVTSDPLAEVYWTFNGSQSLKTSDRIGIIQEIERPNILRSVLNINSADGRWNGTFGFVAESSGGRTRANYTLNVQSVTLITG